MLDRLTLDQLRILIAVAETGSFSAAARRLGRVQSAISYAVQSLEKELRIKLFDRREKTPRVTDAGRAITRDAKLLLEGVDALRSRAQGIADDLEPEITLAVDGAFPDKAIMKTLRGTERKFPRLPVTLYTEYFDGAERRLRDGSARLAIFHPGHAEAADLQIESLISVPIVPVVSSSHPLASIKGSLSREILRKYVQLVLTDRAEGPSDLSGTIISQNVWRFADLESRLKYLLAGFGWCSMPLHLVKDHITAKRLRRFEIRGSARPRAFELSVVYLSGRPPGRAGRWLIDDLKLRLSGATAVRT